MHVAWACLHIQVGELFPGVLVCLIQVHVLPQQLDRPLQVAQRLLAADLQAACPQCQCDVSVLEQAAQTGCTHSQSSSARDAGSGGRACRLRMVVLSALTSSTLAWASWTLSVLPRASKYMDYHTACISSASYFWAVNAAAHHRGAHRQPQSTVALWEAPAYVVCEGKGQVQAVAVHGSDGCLLGHQQPCSGLVSAELAQQLAQVQMPGSSRSSKGTALPCLLSRSEPYSATSSDSLRRSSLTCMDSNVCACVACTSTDVQVRALPVVGRCANLLRTPCCPWPGQQPRQPPSPPQSCQ